MEEGERPRTSPSSEVGWNHEGNQRDSTSNDESKWLLLMEQQNRNFMALINAMKTPSSASKDIRLPEFDPDKENVDARAWISTADMCITDPDMQGAPLMMTLSRALKGQASTWLSQVSFHGMTWSNFKDLFTTRYESAETAAGFLINLQSSRPKDSECLASYASKLMSSLMSRWKNLSVEQIAVSTVLSHISQFENRVQRLSFTQNITTRNELQQELKAVSFMKRNMPSTNDHNHDAKKPRLATDVSTAKCFVCGKSGHKAAQCRLRKGSNTRDNISKTQSDMKISSTPSHTCFSCGAAGHFAKNCPRRSIRESSSNTTAGPLQEKRVNVCTVNAPTGMLHHADSGNLSMESAFCALMAPSPLLELSSIFFFFVPAVLILCLYVRMGLHIRSTRIMKKTKSLLNGQVHGETRQAKSRKAIIRMLAAVVIAFFVCWAPFHIQRLFYIYGWSLPQFQVINEHLFNVAGALYYVSATVNPILYNVMSGRYRLAFQETLLCRKIQRRDSRGTTFDLTSCRETPVPSFSAKSLRQKRESRIAFISKVDYIKEDPSPFCVDDEESKINGDTVIYYYNDVKKVQLENGSV